MSKTLTVEGDINAVDTLTRLTAQGSVSAPSRVTPANSKQIIGILASFSVDGAAEGSGVFLLRLGGSAVKNGEQTIIIGGAGTNTVQAGGDAAPIAPGLLQLKEVDIAIESTSVISIAAEMVGEDLGDSTVVITLIYA